MAKTYLRGLNYYRKNFAIPAMNGHSRSAGERQASRQCEMSELQPQLDTYRFARFADRPLVRSSRTAWIGMGLMATAGILLIFLFPGSAEQDTDYHFLMARTAWVDSSFFVNVWARPLFTTLFAPTAQLGYTAARFFALLISLTVGWQTYRLATDLQLPRSWLVIFVLLGQPVFFELYTDLYTEILFALVFVLGVRCHVGGRIKRGMLIASLLPLARPEGVFLCILWGVWVLVHPEPDSDRAPSLLGAMRRLPLTLILALGVVCWWLAALILTGDPLFILHNWPETWHRNMYGHGTFFSYGARSLEFAGGLLIVPLIAGLCFRILSHKWLPITSGFLLIFLLHSIFRRYGLFGEAGYPRYMVSIAPAIAVLTLDGCNRIMSIDLPRIILLSLGFIVLALSLLTSMLYLDAMSWARDPIAIDEMAGWLKEHYHPLPQVIWSNGRMCSVLGLNFKISPALSGRENLITRLRKAPSGSIVFWDDHIGPEWFGMTSADVEQQGYRLLRARQYLLHAMLYPDNRFTNVPWAPFINLLGPRELTLSLLEKP
jgi:hypothetical protein